MLIRLYFLYLNKEFFFDWNIYTFNSIKFNFLLLVDYKSLMFIFLVRIIFSIIIIYRGRYMDLREVKMDRFLYLWVRRKLNLILSFVPRLSSLNSQFSPFRGILMETRLYLYAFLTPWRSERFSNAETGYPRLSWWTRARRC